MANQLPASEKKAKTLDETMKEMAPFAIYAIVPLVITVFIAFYFGSTAN